MQWHASSLTGCHARLWRGLRRIDKRKEKKKSKEMIIPCNTWIFSSFIPSSLINIFMYRIFLFLVAEMVRLRCRFRRWMGGRRTWGIYTRVGRWARRGRTRREWVRCRQWLHGSPRVSFLQFATPLQFLATPFFFLIQIPLGRRS